MDLQAVLSEVRNWAAEDRLRLIEELWDGLVDSDLEDGPPEDVKELLDHRIAASDKTAQATAWDEIHARAIERFDK